MHITTEAQLRAIIGEPAELVLSKISDRLVDETRPFIERSPFVVVATADADGNLDISPRGDPPGFVRILDDRTLFLPERPGNRIADTLRNILVNPHVGLLFVIPGIGDTLRVHGRAELVDDADLLAGSVVEGKAPKLGVVVHIDEVYTQCSKAFLRSEFWNPERFADRASLPTGGEILRGVQASRHDTEPVDPVAYDTARAERYARREGFY